MRRAIVWLVLGACAPKGDYTPQIAIEPFALRRICFVCQEREGADEGSCSPEVADACDRLRSDVISPPKITWLPEEEPDAAAR
jgi:hypothetical protein